MEELEIPKPQGEAVTSIKEGIEVAEKIGYPVLVRPSYVLGGRAMQIVGSKKALEKYLKTAVALKLSQLEYVKQEIEEYPVLLLDDVMSELDENRRAHLLQFIDGKVQTFITVNDRELIQYMTLRKWARQ